MDIHPAYQDIGTHGAETLIEQQCVPGAKEAQIQHVEEKSRGGQAQDHADEGIASYGEDPAASLEHAGENQGESFGLTDDSGDDQHGQGQEQGFPVVGEKAEDFFTEVQGQDEGNGREHLHPADACVAVAVP